MFKRTALSCAVLVLTVAAPVFAQDARPSTASEDVIQDPMPRSRAQEPEPAAPPPAAPVGEKGVRAWPRTAVSLNPVMLLLGGIGAEVETAVHSSFSLYVAPSFLFFDSVLAPGAEVSGFGVDVGFRYFSQRKAPKGLWIGPNAGIAFVNSGTALSLGGMLGHSWIFDNSFYFSLGIGGGYTVVLRNSYLHSAGPALTLRIALGFAG